MSLPAPIDLQKVIVQEDFSYGDHELQKLSVYHHFGKEESAQLAQRSGLWIIYIHGGAWRDPTITDQSIRFTLRTVYSRPSIRELLHNEVTAFASLSYRLSAHPDYPQKSGTPINILRKAKHPEHLEDVIKGISFLQEKYGFGSKYMLIGHSCGATLAFQSIIRTQLSIPASIPFTNPQVVVGVAGIYDLKLLRDKNPYPAYHEFLAQAFGVDEKVWDLASPAKHDLAEVWPEVKTVIVVSSSKDEMIDPTQIECMRKSLGSLREKATVKVLQDFLDQSHDHIWDDGEGLAKVIVESLMAWLSDGSFA
ncbi:hypothetical protein VTL71DRAFT_12214 [Oculimacula yallundae]|uniref:Kynurenine formamidase n=1 Tax=Oculimacula yallundae TaxID=86028 RepID=A0ABR4CUN2_9HELO